MEKTDNPYTILGLSSDADEPAIKKAYFNLAKKWHPDKHATDFEREVATQAFAKIAEAYELLQDPVRRYDWRKANESTSRTSSPSPSSGNIRHMRSLTPERNNPNNTTTLSALKRTKSGQGCKVMKVTVRPNGDRVSPVQGIPLVRPSVRVPSSNPTVVVPGRSPARSPVRNSGGRSPARASVVPPGRSSARSPARNSGGRSPARASVVPGRSSARSPARSSGNSQFRNSGGRSPARNSGGRSPARAVASGASAVRRPHPANDRGRAPIVTNGVTIPLNRHPSPGRRKARPNSVGRKPKKNSFDSHHSDHGPSGNKPASERRRRLKRTSSLRLPQQ